VLDIPVPKIMLKGARIMPIISELIAASVAQHVRMNSEWHFGGFPKPLD